MEPLKTLDAVLNQLQPGMTTKALAENMCSPFWQANSFTMGGEIMIALDEMKDVATQVLSEIQHSLVDEFVEALDSPDDARRQTVVELMKLYIPEETNQALFVAAMGETFGIQKTKESTPSLRRKL